MEYFLRSIATRSFWKYALFSGAGLGRAFSAIGVTWTFIELLDFLGIYQKAQYGKFAIFPILGVGVIYAVLACGRLRGSSTKSQTVTFVLR